MRWRREEYLELMTFGDAPRPMFSKLDFPVKEMADWLKLKPLYSFTEQRIDTLAIQKAIAAGFSETSGHSIAAGKAAP